MWMWSHGMDPLIERRRGAARRLEAHGGGTVRGVPQRPRVVDQQRGDRRLCLRTVDERQTFLGPQLHRLDAGLIERRGGGPPGALPSDLTLTNQAQREVCEGCQIARGANTALLRHTRMDPCVEQRDEGSRERRSDTAGLSHQHVRPEEHHRAYDCHIQGLTHP